MLSAGEDPATVAIQVIPLAAGAHEGLRGAGFVIADFEESGSAAYQDAASSGQMLTLMEKIRAEL